MLDTSTCIHIMRSDDRKLWERVNRHAEQLCISSLVLAELRFGAENSSRVADNLDTVEEFSARLVVLSFDAEAASSYGRLRFLIKTQPIGALDMLIAAHARSADLIFVTDTVGEFERVPDLRIENWVR